MGVFEQFPYTNFHELNESWFIQKFKELTAEWAEEQTAFNSAMDAWQSLRNYVHDYFNNLDVQEEIDNKLDEFYENGVLAEIIAPHLPADVAAWLTEHLTPTTPPVDNTLSIAGAAADSKLVGDLFTARTLKRVAAYTDALSMENNSYYTSNGSKFTGTLGENFKWTLTTGTTYRLERYPISYPDSGSPATSIVFKLTDLSGRHLWIGYKISTATDITWNLVNTNETDFTNLKNVVDYRTLKHISPYTNPLEMAVNSYTTGGGSKFIGTLGVSFTWSLGETTSYRLEKYALYTTEDGESSGSIIYRLFSMSGNDVWGGWTISGSTAVTWAKINTSERDFMRLMNIRTLRYVPMSDYSDALSMDNNTYVTGSGSQFVGTLGTNFTWTLGTSTSYRLEKTNLRTGDDGEASSSYTYKLYDLSTNNIWGGYKIASTPEIVWSKTNVNEKQLDENIIVHNTTNIDNTNYTTEFPYSSANSIKKSCVYTFNSSITASMIDGLPVYGATCSILTLRAQKNSLTSSASNYNRLQLAWTTNGNKNREMYFRVSFSQTDTTWGDWQTIHSAKKKTAKACFCGTSTIWGHTTDGARSVNNVPAVYANERGIEVENRGVKGGALIKDWATIYGTADKNSGYNFDGFDLFVTNWNSANDKTALDAYPLGTGADVEGTTTVLGHFNQFLKKITTLYPTMSIVWLGSTGVWSGTPPTPYTGTYAGGGLSFTRNELLDGIKSVCAKYFIPYIDFREANPFNINNYNTLFIADHVHYTDLGYAKYAGACIAGIDRYYTPIV